MDRKHITADLAEFLKSKVSPGNKITIHGESQIRIEGNARFDRKTAFSWVEEFFNNKSIHFKRNELGFVLEELLFTVTVHDYGRPPRMAIISSKYFEGKELFQ